MSHTVQKDELDHAGLHLFIIFRRRDHFLRIETGNRCRNGEILHQCPVCIDLILVHKTALLTDIHGCKGTDRNTVTVEHRKIL